MKLNEHFGRVNRRHSAGYLALRDRLQQQGIADSTSAATVASGMSRAAILVLAAIAALCALVALVLPDMGGLVLVLGGLLAVWVMGNYFQARMHLKRYVMEECQSGVTKDLPSQRNQSNQERP